MQDENRIKLYLLILVMGMVQLMGIEHLLGISKYAHLYKPIIFTLVAYWVWKLPRKRAYIKLYFQSDFFVWAIILALLFLVSTFLGGVLNSFGKNPYILTPKWILLNFFMYVLPVMITIYARQYLISAARPKKRVALAVGITLWLALSQFSFFQYTAGGFTRNTIIFLVGVVLPVLAREVLLTYLAFMAGPKPANIYMFLTTMPFFVLSVIPDLEWIIAALVKSFIPLFGLMILHESYVGKAKLEKLRHQKKESMLSMVLMSILSISMIWFAVGVFPIYPKVILTGSMLPDIMPGDMVLVEFIHYEDVKIGDTLLYEYGNIEILHRVIAINEDGSLFQLKGDNNPVPDPDWVMPEQIKAVHKGTVPYIGRPLLWLRSN